MSAAFIRQGARLLIVAIALAGLVRLATMPGAHDDPWRAMPTKPLPLICTWWPGQDHITTTDGRVIKLPCPAASATP